MKDFKKLIVWQKSFSLFLDIHLFTKKLPPEERFELSSQLRRAAFSIPANIAEGGAKSSQAHYKVFLENSLGSTYELETALLSIEKLYPQLTDEANQMVIRTCEVQKMLISLIQKLDA